MKPELLQAIANYWLVDGCKLSDVVEVKHRATSDIDKLIAAYEQAQAEVELLEERDEMAKRLADYCRMTIETGALNYGSSIAIAYRDYMATREEQKKSVE